MGQNYANQGEYMRLLDTHNKAMQLIRGGRTTKGIGELMGNSGLVNQMYMNLGNQFGNYTGGTDLGVGGKSASFADTLLGGQAATTPASTTSVDLTGKNLAGANLATNLLGGSTADTIAYGGKSYPRAETILDYESPYSYVPSGYDVSQFVKDAAPDYYGAVGSPVPFERRGSFPTGLFGFEFDPANINPNRSTGPLVYQDTQELRPFWESEGLETSITGPGNIKY